MTLLSNTHPLFSLTSLEFSVLNDNALYSSSVFGISTGPSRGILGVPLVSDEIRPRGAGENDTGLT